MLEAILIVTDINRGEFKMFYVVKWGTEHYS